MIVFTARQIQELDRLAMTAAGIPSLVLMENAGRKASQEVLRLLDGKKNVRVHIVCGTGNNGGDGFVTARHLSLAGLAVKVFLVGEQKQLKEAAQINFEKLKNLKIQIVSSIQAALESNDLTHCDCLVDALFGFGLNRTLEKNHCKIIDRMNGSGVPIVAMDVPSGLDATTGEIHGAAVHADLTVTFTALKKGLLTNQGPQCCGKIQIADIGIPQSLIDRFNETSTE